LLAPPRTRLQRFSTRVHLLSVAFQAHWLDGRHWYDQGLPVVMHSRACPQLEKTGVRLARVLKHIAPNVDGSIQQIRLDEHDFLNLLRALPDWMEAYVKAMNICGICASRPQALDNRVTAAQQHLKTWPLHEDLDPAYLARMCGLGQRQLERLFLSHFDTTPHRYLEQLRLQTACSVLRQRNVQVKSIALRLGFGDSSHFSHWFRRWTGSSPRAFRNKLIF
jgi:AraC-like DNA-binding protein